MPRSCHVAETLEEASVWLASQTPDLRALCFYSISTRHLMLAACSHGYVLCRIPVSAKFWTSTTALWPTIPCAFSACRPITGECPFE
ncbi:hypothetical protein MRX96_043702 [Rhipicephalus microplus]